MMFRPVLIAWIIPFAYSAFGSPAASRSVDLAPKLEVGAEFHYVSRSLINHEMQVDAADVADKIVVRTESGMVLTVTDVGSNGSVGIAWQLRYVAISADGPIPGIGEMLDYDSRDPGQGSSPLAPMFSRLVGSPVTVRVDAQARVIDFKGLNTAGLVGPLGALARGFFSREAFEQLPLFVTRGAPSPARLRSKWSGKTTMDMPLGVGSLVMQQDFVVKRISARNRKATIEVKGTVTKGAAKGSSGLGLVPSSLVGTLVVDNGTITGEYIWDFAAGRLFSAETQLKLETTLDTPLGRMGLKQDMSCSVKWSAPRTPRPTGKPRRRP